MKCVSALLLGTNVAPSFVVVVTCCPRQLRFLGVALVIGTRFFVVQVFACPWVKLWLSLTNENYSLARMFAGLPFCLAFVCWYLAVRDAGRWHRAASNSLRRRLSDERGCLMCRGTRSQTV